MIDQVDVVQIGSQIHFSGQPWRVASIVQRGERTLFCLDSLIGVFRDCIAADGSDGPWELLEEAAAGEGFSHGGPGEPGTGQVSDCVKQLSPSPAARIPDRFEPRPWRP